MNVMWCAYGCHCQRLHQRRRRLWQFACIFDVSLYVHVHIHITIYYEFRFDGEVMHIQMHQDVMPLNRARNGENALGVIDEYILNYTVSQINGIVTEGFTWDSGGTRPLHAAHCSRVIEPS